MTHSNNFVYKISMFSNPLFYIFHPILFLHFFIFLYFGFLSSKSPEFFSLAPWLPATRDRLLHGRRLESGCSLRAPAGLHIDTRAEGIESAQELAAVNSRDSKHG
jgi:hypothetical protein